MVPKGPAGGAGLLRAVPDPPAGDQGEESLDAGDADLLPLDHAADTANALDIRL
jgi:hypothetical protein